MKHVSQIPKWFVANCSSMLSLESMKGHAMTPALFLPITNKQIRKHYYHWFSINDQDQNIDIHGETKQVINNFNRNQEKEIVNERQNCIRGHFLQFVSNFSFIFKNVYSVEPSQTLSLLMHKFVHMITERYTMNKFFTTQQHHQTLVDNSKVKILDKN